MIRTQLNDQQLDMGPVTIRAFRSLTKRHVEVIATTVAALPTEWSLNLHDDYEGYLSIIIQPVESTAATVLISGTTERVDLSTLDLQERVQNRGCFPTIEAAANEVANLISAAQ